MLPEANPDGMDQNWFSRFKNKAMGVMEGARSPYGWGHAMLFIVREWEIPIPFDPRVEMSGNSLLRIVEPIIRSRNTLSH